MDIVVAIPLILVLTLQSTLLIVVIGKVEQLRKERLQDRSQEQPVSKEKETLLSQS